MWICTEQIIFTKYSSLNDDYSQIYYLYYLGTFTHMSRSSFNSDSKKLKNDSDYIHLVIFFFMSLQDSSLIRCDSLDAGSGCDREAMTPFDPMTYDPEGSDLAANLEPTPAELAQCEAEVGTLLTIIAELNKKMGSLKAPRYTSHTMNHIFLFVFIYFTLINDMLVLK